MPINSRAKGKRGELEVAALLRELGYVARRGQQFAGGTDSPDIVHNIEGLHLEAKFTEKLALWDALKQAKRDARIGETPVVIHRKSNEDWVVIMPARDFLTNYTRRT